MKITNPLSSRSWFRSWFRSRSQSRGYNALRVSNILIFTAIISVTILPITMLKMANLSQSFREEEDHLGNRRSLPTPTLHQGAKNKDGDNSASGSLLLTTDGGDNDINVDTTTTTTTATTIGYAISITGCGTHSYNLYLLQGAAVLGHSIHLSSSRNPKSGSKYNYKLHAFVHPTAIPCSSDLSNLGYHIHITDTPVQPSEIRGEYLRNRIVDSGCCGEKEFLKLYSYTLLEHSIVVHLDVDTLVMQPLDDLFDAMLENNDTHVDGASESRGRNNDKLPVMFHRPVPHRIDAFFTRDYNMVNNPNGPVDKVGVQGGFLVVRTSQQTFDEYVRIIQEGNFQSHVGWGQLGYGGYYGSMQIQGLCSYFYGHVHPNTAVELNRCVYNTMVDNPRWESKKRQSTYEGKCLTGEVDCEDCRLAKVENIKTAHFTLCGKPWICHNWFRNNSDDRLCRELHQEWFRIRKDFDETWGSRGVVKVDSASGSYHPETFFGYCTEAGRKGYIPFQLSATAEEKIEVKQ